MPHPLYLKRLLQVALLSLAALPVLGALLVGTLWMRSSLPHPATVDPLALNARIDVSPRQAAIPWRRDPDALPHLNLTPAWAPWQKTPKGARPTQTGGPPPAGTPRVSLNPAEATTVTDGFSSPDAARRQTALLQMESLVERDPLAAADYLRNAGAPWSRLLLQNRSYDALDRVTDRLLLAEAHDTRSLESICSLRVKTSLAAGNAPAALQRCREWFAISTLFGTAPVLTAVEEALTLQHASKADLRAFRATVSAPAATSAPATQTAFSLRLNDQSPDAFHFLAAARQIFGEDYPALIARGNLYLLAARPDLARPVFRRALMLATDQQLPAAAECLARCIKADTGSLAAANDFVEQHR